MEFLENFTKEFDLKKSFYYYLGSFLFLGFLIGKIFETLLSMLRKNMLKSALNSYRVSIYYISTISYLRFISSIIIYFFIIIFIIISFNKFYKEKLDPIVEATSKLDTSYLLYNKNELSEGAYTIIEKIYYLERVNIKNLLVLNERSKTFDTLLHEIRNPLSTIKGDIKLLELMNYYDDKNIRDIFKRLSRNEERIENYLKNISDFKNFKDIKINLDKQNIYKLLENIKNIYNENPLICIESDLSDYDIFINIDCSYFIEAFDNIIRNANRYANKEIKILIKENKKSIVIYIIDDGPGFSKEALVNYNKAYYTDSSLDGSLGLGLYLADIIFKKQNIDLSIENKNGACVKLSIPKV